MRNSIRLLAAAISAAALFRAPDAAAKLPVGTPTLRGARQPALLSEYERKVLELEYAKLLRAVREARAEAANLRQGLERAMPRGQRRNSQSRRR